MFGLFKRDEVADLKRKARKWYIARERIFDEMDCGHELAMFISGRYARAHTEFEKVMARLTEIDPQCPPHDTDPA